MHDNDYRLAFTICTAPTPTLKPVHPAPASVKPTPKQDQPVPRHDQQASKPNQSAAIRHVQQAPRLNQPAPQYHANQSLHPVILVQVQQGPQPPLGCFQLAQPHVKVLRHPTEACKTQDTKLINCMHVAMIFSFNHAVFINFTSLGDRDCSKSHYENCLKDQLITSRKGILTQA